MECAPLHLVAIRAQRTRSMALSHGPRRRLTGSTYGGHAALYMSAVHSDGSHQLAGHNSVPDDPFRSLDVPPSRTSPLSMSHQWHPGMARRDMSSMPPMSINHTAIEYAAKGSVSYRRTSTDSQDCYSSTGSSHGDSLEQNGRAGAWVSNTAPDSKPHRPHALRGSRTSQLTDVKHAARFADSTPPRSLALVYDADRQQAGDTPRAAVYNATPAVSSSTRNSNGSLERSGSSSDSSSTARSSGTIGLGLWSCNRGSASWGTVELPQVLLPLSGCRWDSDTLEGPGGAKAPVSPEQSRSTRERQLSRLSGSAAQLSGSTRAQALLRKTLSAHDRPQPPQLAPDKARQTSSLAPCPAMPTASSSACWRCRLSLPPFSMALRHSSLQPQQSRGAAAQFQKPSRPSCRRQCSADRTTSSRHRGKPRRLWHAMLQSVVQTIAGAYLSSDTTAQHPDAQSCCIFRSHSPAESATCPGK